jgi:hypothetical protein
MIIPAPLRRKNMFAVAERDAVARVGEGSAFADVLECGARFRRE